MTALHLNWVLQTFITKTATLLRFVLLYCLQQLLPILLLGKFRVVYPSPSLLLSLLEIFLQLPPCLVIGSVVKIETAVAEGTVS